VKETSSKVTRWLQVKPAREGLPLIRVSLGWVFLTSGLLKFLYVNQGVGRFAKIGIPMPDLLSPFVGGVEMVCGTLLLLGLFARLAALPLIADMLVALLTTKIPLLFGPGPEPLAAAPKMGLAAFAYASRLDLAMLVSCACVALVGAGSLSLDAWRRARVPLARPIDEVGSPRAAIGQ
jgi:putative oxidoreductase